MPKKNKKLDEMLRGRGKFVNQSEGSARFGQRYNVVTKDGVRYHQYSGGRLVADKQAGPRGVVGARWGTTTPVRSASTTTSATKAPGGAGGGTRRQRDVLRQSPGRTTSTTATTTASTKPTTTTTARTYTTDPAKRAELRAKATGSGRFLNVSESSPSYGKRFGIVTKNDTRYHRYGGRGGKLVADVARGAGTARFKPPATGTELADIIARTTARLERLKKRGATT